MKILLIEDDERKREHLEAFLTQAIEGVCITIAGSYRSGLVALGDEGLDLVVLDMAIPTYDVTAFEPGGRPHAFGGRELLHQMVRRGSTVPVVVVTQYEKFGEGSQASTLSELDEELGQLFGAQYRGAVHYSPSADTWKGDLLSRLDVRS